MNFIQLRQHAGYTEHWRQVMGDPQIIEGLRAIRAVVLSPPVESYDIATNALQNKFTQGALAVFEMIEELSIYTDGAAPQPLPSPYQHIADRKRAEVEASAAVYAAEKAAEAEAAAKAKAKATTE